MISGAQELLLHNNYFAVTGAIVLLWVVLSFISHGLYKSVKIYLWSCIIIWIICFGYEVKTGNNLYDSIVDKFHSDTDGVSEENAVKDLRYKSIKSMENEQK